MARLRQPARVRKWRGDFFIFWYDATTGKQRRTKCSMLKATNAKQRQDLVNDYRVREINENAESIKRGGQFAYTTPVLDALKTFINHVESREQVRKANPESREGISEAAAKELRDTINRLTKWIEQSGKKKLTTGRLDSTVLGHFFNFLATETTRRGNKETKRSAATLNKHRSNLRACLNYLNAQRPPLFPDFDILQRAIKPVRAEPGLPIAFSAKELSAFLAAAVAFENPARKVQIDRKRKGKPREKFEQSAPSTAVTPVSRLFLLLALTGCRLGEALKLRWTDVDLDRGRITIRAQKTGRIRILPLKGAAEAEIAPSFVTTLKKWHEEAGKSPYVLPHGDLPEPIFPKGAWQTVNALAKVRRIGPQMLRQNFCAYAASLGVPPAVAALWQGHSAAVAERWYRAQVLDRIKADTFEEAMGLRMFVEQEP